MWGGIGALGALRWIQVQLTTSGSVLPPVRRTPVHVAEGAEQIEDKLHTTTHVVASPTLRSCSSGSSTSPPASLRTQRLIAALVIPTQGGIAVTGGTIVRDGVRAGLPHLQCFPGSFVPVTHPGCLASIRPSSSGTG